MANEQTPTPKTPADDAAKVQGVAQPEPAIPQAVAKAVSTYGNQADAGAAERIRESLEKAGIQQPALPQPPQ